MRSLAKEVGRKGITAQLIYVAKGAESRLETPLRFFLSRHSAFVDGQVVHLTKEAQGEVTSEYTQVLNNKVALVTGAARGIGAAIAERLAAEGAKVVCLDRLGEEALLGQVAEPIGGEALTVDITSADAADRIANHMGDNHGGVDIVVHNAGIARDKTLTKMSEDWWDTVLDINLASVVPINERLLQDTLHKKGRIVCLSSIAGIAGNAGQTNYAASKAGLIGYVAALGKQTAKHGITANAVAPGFIETRMTGEIPLANRQAGRRLSSLSQGGLPSDVAEAVTFFASPGANGLNGQVLRVCGQSLLGA
jgi:3-oxoacyl-[acyl-carrier protein] reductase